MNGAPDQDIAVFTEALRLTPEERARYLSDACKEDAEFRRRVEALLLAYEQSGDFLGRPAAEMPRKATPLPAGEKPGDRIGHYKLLQQLGEGGCGVVYLAEQEEPVRRRVALKIIKPGMDTKSVIARFEAERQALALMDHPNIAHVFEAGATESGRPYFVMELVKGVKLTDHCDQYSLSLDARLELLIQVCDAIQHAHQKGIIHRDIKPSNILVTTGPDRRPVPKVIDFGIAKAITGQQLTDKTIFTAYEMLIGTPAYMSPEQAALSITDVDTRTDIYSLGVLLYELLTGTTPFDTLELLKVGFDEIRRVIRDEQPVRPSTRLSTIVAADPVSFSKNHGEEAPRVIRQMRGELDWIVMKALEKDRTRRYATANGLAMDIQRYLARQPVLACPPSRLYQFRKLISRHKLEFAALGTVLATLVAGLSSTTWSLVREKQAHHVADLAQKKALTEATRSKEVARFLDEMLTSGNLVLANGTRGVEVMLRDMLDNAAARVGRELTNQPAVQAELKVTIGRVYGSLALYERAEAMIQGALMLSGQLPDSEEIVAHARQTLSFIYAQQQKNAQSREEARKAMAIIVKLRGEENMDVVMLETMLANADTRAGKLAEAESRCRKALAIGRRLGEDQSGQLLEARFALAQALGSQGKLAEAEDVARDCVSVAQKRYGPDAVMAAVSMNILAYLLDNQQKLAEAETVLRQSVAIFRKKLPDHPLLDSALWGLGSELQHEGKNEQAADVERELLGIRRKLYREGDDRLMETANTLVKLLVPDLDQAKLAHLAGEIPEAWAVLSEDLARQGRWRDARTAASKLLELQPGNPSAYHLMAPLLVQTADPTGYEELCQRITTRFAEATDPRVADRMAKDCLILPRPGADLKRPGKLAETAVTKGERDTGALPFFQCCKALAEYRLGNWEEATNWANRAASNSFSYVRAEANAILAMAQFQLKHAQDAREALNKCTEVVRTKLPKLTDKDLGGDWRDLIIAHALQSEAKRMIDGPASSTANSSNLPQ